MSVTSSRSERRAGDAGSLLPFSPVNGVPGTGVDALTCVAGVLPSIPLFALISSTGRAATGGTARTLSVTYAVSSIMYCLTSPGSIAAGQYVTVAVCPAGATGANMSWTYRLDTGIDTTSNRIESTFARTFSKLVLATCTDSDLQKWNVLPSVVHGLVTDVVEK